MIDGLITTRFYLLGELRSFIDSARDANERWAHGDADDTELAMWLMNLADRAEELVNSVQTPSERDK